MPFLLSLPFLKLPFVKEMVIFLIKYSSIICGNLEYIWLKNFFPHKRVELFLLCTLNKIG